MVKLNLSALILVLALAACSQAPIAETPTATATNTIVIPTETPSTLPTFDFTKYVTIHIENALDENITEVMFVKAGSPYDEVENFPRLISKQWEYGTVHEFDWLTRGTYQLKVKANYEHRASVLLIEIANTGDFFVLTKELYDAGSNYLDGLTPEIPVIPLQN